MNTNNNIVKSEVPFVSISTFKLMLADAGVSWFRVGATEDGGYAIFRHHSKWCDIALNDMNQVIYPMQTLEAVVEYDRREQQRVDGHLDVSGVHEWLYHMP